MGREPTLVCIRARLRIAAVRLSVDRPLLNEAKYSSPLGLSHSDPACCPVDPCPSLLFDWLHHQINHLPFFAAPHRRRRHRHRRALS